MYIYIYVYIYVCIYVHIPIFINIYVNVYISLRSSSLNAWHYTYAVWMHDITHYTCNTCIRSWRSPSVRDGLWDMSHTLHIFRGWRLAARFLWDVTFNVWHDSLNVWHDSETVTNGYFANGGSWREFLNGSAGAQDFCRCGLFSSSKTWCSKCGVRYICMFLYYFRVDMVSVCYLYNKFGIDVLGV